MKAGNGKHFEQAYNAQAAVDVEGSYLILGKRVTNNPNDKKELVPTVEPVFGTIKETLGFRHFHLRGLEKAGLEWDIVTLAYNFNRLYNMTGGFLLSEKCVLKAVNA